MSLFLFVYLSFCRISQPFLRCGNACAVTLFCCWTSRRIFSCVLRWRCRRCTCSRTGRTDRQSWVFVLHMIWDAHDVVQTSVSASVTTRKEKLKQFNPPLSKACWACIDALKQLSLQHKGTHSEKGHNVFTLRQKLLHGYQQARSVHQELPRYASFSYTNLCLAVTTLPPRAKGTPCSDSRPLGSITQLPGSMHSSHHIPLLGCNATLASSKSTASSNSDFIAAASAARLPKVSSSA